MNMKKEGNKTNNWEDSLFKAEDDRLEAQREEYLERKYQHELED